MSVTQERERLIPEQESQVVSDWRAALLKKNATLEEAIRNLDRTGLQIALVVADHDILLGTITDGDVRRGLLRGLTLQSSVQDVMERNPLAVPPEIGRESALQLMHTNYLTALPVVDPDRRVVDLHLLNALLTPTDRPNTMVIMAGGRGSRLRRHTDDRPKPLVPVGGKPMLEHIIDKARAEGFSSFVLSVHYLAEMVEDYFGDGGRWDVSINYVREDSPLGTAGALSLLDPRPESALIVSNCDIISDIRYAELLDFHSRHNAAATMAVRLHEWQHPFGVVLTDGVDIVGFEEKPIARTHVNAGVYVLGPEALESLEHHQHCDMPSLFERLQGEGERTIVYPMHEPWLDVGREEDLERVRADYSTKS